MYIYTGKVIETKKGQSHKMGYLVTLIRFIIFSKNRLLVIAFKNNTYRYRQNHVQ